MSNSAVINRALTSIRNELEFLKDSGVITDAFYNDIDNKLPQRHQQGAPPVDVGSGAAASARSATAAPPPPPPPPPSGPPAQQQDTVEALYDYHAADPSDLTLYKGARIVVLERMNNDWWRGRNLSNGAEGLFPSNYVRAEEPSRAPSANSLPQYDEKRGFASPPPAGPPPAQQYQPPPPQHYQPPPPQQYQQPPFPPPSTGYYQPPPPQMQAPPPEQQQPEKESHLKKYGSKLGDAAVFGAGATIGSEIVHSIF